MDSSESPDFKALYEREKKRANQERERANQAEEQTAKERERANQAEERSRDTTFEEFIRACHNLLSLPASAQARSRSTKGSVKKPTGKLCPTSLQYWEDCSEIQEEFYRHVCDYLQPTDKDTPRLFSSIAALEDTGRKYCHRALGSEKDLEFHQRLAVEQHVYDVIAELCKISEARDEFALGDGVIFENHRNAIDEDPDTATSNHQSTAQRSIPDQFCIHRLNGEVSTLLTTVEYKPPHKLSVENLRVGLRPMNLWEEVVQQVNIPTEKDAKLIYNAEQVSASALVQEFHVMISEGLQYSYVTNGMAYVLLHVRGDDPSTLYYYYCEPNIDVDLEDDRIIQQPKTAIARVLCLCLMSCLSQPRDHGWRNDARQQLRVWETDLDYALAQIPEEERHQTPPDSDHVPSSPFGSPTADDHRPTTRHQGGCAPSNPARRLDSESSDSDSHPAAPRRKRNLSQLTSSPPNPRLLRQRNISNSTQNTRQHEAKFCTQKCLLGLQREGPLDENCPNVNLHRQGPDSNRHAISAEDLVRLLKQQLDESLDHNCTPFGNCGSYGAPFKITCNKYGYTVVGKGTTSFRWNEISREEDVYRVLHKAQGSAIPVFLGSIDLELIYQLHGAGEIKHMLLMAWGGDKTSRLAHSQRLRAQIKRSKTEIYHLGIRHQDLRSDNILWNPELGRALIIDFHRSKPIYEQIGKGKSLKRLGGASRSSNAKRARVA